VVLTNFYKMKLGLDIHGIITEIPDPLSVITKLLVDNGHEVHILTGETLSEKLINELEKWGIYYTHLFSIIDYQEKRGIEITYKDNGPWMDGELWDRTKADYCTKHQIDLMIDDTKRYGKYFTTPFVFSKIIKK